MAELFPDVPRIALTATADKRTREEIVERLHLQNAERFLSSFDRPNIFYRIVPKEQPRKQLLAFLAERRSDAGIVYCLSRKKVDEVAAFLCEQGFPALPYHAGLPNDLRAYHQKRFLNEEGLIMVATIAFGMGIDKPNVRFVAHLDLPKSLEAYYQETGRAGRDGLPADAWMAYGLQDVVMLKQMLQNSEGDERHKRLEQHKLDAMLSLCEETRCRRQTLLAYFDEDMPQPCGHCDNCVDGVETWDATEPARQALSAIFRTGQRYGVGHLVDVLLGKDNEKVRSFGHQHLSVFGVGKARTEGEWRSLFRQLVARGLADIDLEGYGGLRLSATCRPLLKVRSPSNCVVTSSRQRRSRAARARPANWYVAKSAINGKPCGPCGASWPRSTASRRTSSSPTRRCWKCSAVSPPPWRKWPRSVVWARASWSGMARPSSRSWVARPKHRKRWPMYVTNSLRWPGPA